MAEQLLPLVDQLASCCPDLFGSELSDEDAARAAAVFKALADPARVRLLSLVARSAGGEACVCDLVDAVDRSQPTVSHHLKVLLVWGRQRVRCPLSLASQAPPGTYSICGNCSAGSMNGQ